MASTEAFMGKVLGDTVGLTNTALAWMGDELGIWKDLASRGPATSAELASRMGLAERPVREWLHAMTAAGYLAHAGGTFELPAEHAAVLAAERGPVFFGGLHQELLGLLRPIDRIVESFRTGGGVPQSGYPEMAYDGMDRFTAAWFENLLLPVWIPAVGIGARLEAGIDVCDVGCGRGRALVKMAAAFPKSRFVGFDVFGPNVAKATKLAVDAGVSDRVRFVELDAAKGLPGSYDLVTTFDVVHDAADPKGILRSIRESLKPGGTYLCLDINCAPKLDQNLGPLGSLFYGFSVLYCMTTSLAHGGAGLGTCGLHEQKLSELGKEAGFSAVRRMPLENPFNNLYELKVSP